MTIPELYSLFQKYPNISTDSRNCPADAIFFALKGERFDGNDYLLEVLEKGVAYAVGDRPNLPKHDRIIQVDNALQTLQDLANYHRNQMKAKIIAITGTNGKTTTKELTAAALSTNYKILYTEGNLNNHIGVPLTLLQLTPEHEYAVIEMGANHLGEIIDLCTIAEPDYGLITNVGRAHLEGFGSFETIIRTKTELYRYIYAYGEIIFGNADNPHLQSFYNRGNTILYSTKNEDTYIKGRLKQATPFLSLDWTKENTSHFLNTHLVGAYNLENVLAAISISSYLNVPVEKINQALADYIPSNNRSQRTKTTNNELIIDAYNANPSSMRAALENFSSCQETHPKALILGEMNELGKYSQEEHQAIVDYLKSISISNVYLIGKNFLNLSGLLPEWKIFPDTKDLLESLKNAPIKNHVILIKGSRGNRLEQVIEFL